MCLKKIKQSENVQSRGQLCNINLKWLPSAEQRGLKWNCLLSEVCNKRSYKASLKRSMFTIFIHVKRNSDKPHRIPAL